MSHDRERDINTSARSPLALLIIVAGLVMLLLGGFYFWIQYQTSPEQEDSPAPIRREVESPVVEFPVVEQVEEPAPVFSPVPEQHIVMPPATLDGSDPYVQKAIADLAPDVSQWLMASQQIRKWILTIDLMADGQLMKQDRPLNYSMTRFEALRLEAKPHEAMPLESIQQEEETTYRMSASNFSRTDLLISTFITIDVDRLVYYYQKWLPLLDKAYQELGKRGSFHGRIKKALQRVIDVKPLAAEPLLVKKGGVMYRYQDPALESATDIEKLMWRLGPDNSAKLQAYLQQVYSKLPR